MNETVANDLDRFLGKPPPSIWRRYGKWIALAVVALLALLIVTRCSGDDTRTNYVTAEIERGDIAVNVTATGNLAPTNQVDVGSEISGIVETVMVEVNDRVTKGQPIAIIDTSRLDDAVTRSKATLAANEATVGSAYATLAEAQAQLGRLQEVYRLSDGQVPSKTELASQTAAVERARASLRAAEANVVAARAQLSSDSTQVAKAIIRSPVSGVVLKRSIDPGQTVQASFNTPSLFIIAEDLAQMKLEVSIDEADVGQVESGQPATFTVDAYPGRSFPATIERVDLGAKNLSGIASTSTATSTSNVVSYVANLLVNNDDLALRPGMTATASIATAGERNVLMVPNSALRFTPPENAMKTREKSGFQLGPPRSGQVTKASQDKGIGAGSVQTIYVLGEDNNLKPLAVTTGLSDGRNTAVRGKGLKPGMRIVTGVKATAAQ
jgi:HlyD family secretion protein